MKTPREILLQQHRSAEPKLDAIRLKVLKAMRTQEAERAGFGEVLLLGLSQIWTNLFLPSRRIWAGLAMLWLVVIALNVAAPDVSSPTYAGTVTPKNTPERQMALQEQQRLLAELLNGTVRVEAKARPYLPPPSSRRAVRTIRFV